MIDWTQILLALIAGLPSVIAALATLLVTLRGQTQIKDAVKVANLDCAKDVKDAVKEEGLKTALLAQSVKEKTELSAQEVKATLQEAVHKREMVAQEQGLKLDNLIKTTDTVKTLVNGNLTEILKTSTEALIKATENKQHPLPQEIKLTADSEISVVSKD